MTLRAQLRLLCLVSSLTVTLSACGSGTRGVSEDGSPAMSSGKSGEDADSLYYLDLSHSSLIQAIDAKATGRAVVPKFLEVDVVEVTNPKKHLVTFDVSYEPPAAPRALLGSFSLYPADNPGKFLVPTQGRVREKGTIILSLTTPDRTDSHDTVRVAVRRPKLVNQ